MVFTPPSSWMRNTKIERDKQQRGQLRQELACLPFPLYHGARDGIIIAARPKSPVRASYFAPQDTAFSNQYFHYSRCYAVCRSTSRGNAVVTGSRFLDKLTRIDSQTQIKLHISRNTFRRIMVWLATFGRSPLEETVAQCGPLNN